MRAQQTDIRRADAVVVVKVQACQGADEHAVDGFRVQPLGQRRIQPVNALDNHHLPFPQANWRAARIALAEFEGERWQQDLAPIQQFRQMLAEERHIQRADGFEVERAVLLQWDAVAVKVVVIQRNHQRLKPDDVQVECQSLGERCLAGRRRPGNQHDFLVLDGNIRRNVGNRLVVQRFIQSDEVAEAVSLHHLRDVGGVVDAQQRAPPRRLVKHCQMPRAMHIRRSFLWVIGCRQTQNDAAVGQPSEFKDLRHARARRHCAVEIFPHTVQPVHMEERRCSAGEQRDFIRLPLRVKVGNGVVERPFFLLNGRFCAARACICRAMARVSSSVMA